MDFKINENGIDGINEEGKVMAQITYSKIEDGVYNIDHTFVDESLRGQKIAGKLVEMAIEEIKKKNAKVVATCSYARHYLEKLDASTIVLASNNSNKLKEMKEKLKQFGYKVISQKEAGFDIEVEETGKTFEENAIIKAQAIFNQLKKPVIADDSGLEIDVLDGMPGVYSHRFAGDNATDDDRMNKILDLLKDTKEEKRTARFKSVVCYIDSKGEKHIFEGVAEGKIGYLKQGNNGFGYDPIFICENGKTFAELTADEKNAISHRGKAIDKLIKFFH